MGTTVLHSSDDPIKEPRTILLSILDGTNEHTSLLVALVTKHGLIWEIFLNVQGKLDIWGLIVIFESM